MCTVIGTVVLAIGTVMGSPSTANPAIVTDCAGSPRTYSVTVFPDGAATPEAYTNVQIVKRLSGAQKYLDENPGGLVLIPVGAK